ncbi:transglutaminase-like domain-containing protein [Aureispira sp. CCB-E]|uniref:transglutaminase-like domain-containing protein n=1 Tax=Aureispira sp. CCB-E TaxID=3051121 RepID=UPI00286871A7|nr:transglutaminase-like domain-containing protein [Aureispira sp. CCB-E]WMX12296.1 transglutaminase-like domain-containing protein [Aureispira sp. CCB-E]
MIRTEMIPEPSGKIITWFYGDGTTEDIMYVIEQVDQMEIRKGFEEFSKQFAISYEGLYHLWDFVRNKITYRADSENPFLVQDVKDPYSLWALGVGDCKSKTIFVNAVLRCLGVPHLIRYSSYDNVNYTHVYTVAFLNGRKIIIDSVYDYFDKEEYYKKVKDVDNMNGTTIRSIHGIHKNSTPIDACKRLEELRQRKEYVPEQAPIAFNKLSEGIAALKILERRFVILNAMSDEKGLVEKGLGMIQQAISKGVVPTGTIDNSLQGLALMINKFLNQGNVKAINEGVNVQKFRVSYQKAINELKNGGIGSFPEQKCIWDDWNYQYDANLPNDFVGNNLNTALSPFVPSSGSIATMDSQKYRMFYFYGLNSMFRAKFSQVANDIESLHRTLINDGLIQEAIQHLGHWDNISFPNQSSKNAYYDFMKLEMPVMSNYVNSIFRADKKSTLSGGTVSSAVFYPFIDDLVSVSGMTLNDLPATVLTKKVFQDQFLASCNLFSGVSSQNIRMLAENCCLFDNGELPNVTINKLTKIYNPSIQEPITATVAAIAAAIVGIVAAVGAAMASVEKAKTESSKIDSFAATTANFQSPTNSVMPDNLDWLPQVNPPNQNNNNSNSNNNNNNNTNDKGGFPVLPVAVAAGAGLLWVNSKKKKQ